MLISDLVSVVADQFSEYVECDNPLDGIVYLWFELEKTRSDTRKIVQSSSHDALFLQRLTFE